MPGRIIRAVRPNEIPMVRRERMQRGSSRRPPPSTGIFAPPSISRVYAASWHRLIYRLTISKTSTRNISLCFPIKLIPREFTAFNNVLRSNTRPPAASRPRSIGNRRVAHPGCLSAAKIVAEAISARAGPRAKLLPLDIATGELPLPPRREEFRNHRAINKYYIAERMYIS